MSGGPYFPIGSPIPPATPTDIMRSELIARMMNYLDCCLYMTDRGKLHGLSMLKARLEEIVRQHVEWTPPKEKIDAAKE